MSALWMSSRVFWSLSFFAIVSPVLVSAQNPCDEYKRAIGQLKHEVAALAPSPHKTALALTLFSRTHPARWRCTSRPVRLWLATVRTFAAMEADSNNTHYADSVLATLSQEEMIDFGRYLYEYRARMLLGLGQARGAVESYATALRLDSLGEHRSPVSTAQLLGYSGEAHEAAGDVQEAYCRYDRALYLVRSESPKANVFRAKMHRLLSNILTRHSSRIGPCSEERGSVPGTNALMGFLCALCLCAAAQLYVQARNHFLRHPLIASPLPPPGGP